MGLKAAEGHKAGVGLRAGVYIYEEYWALSSEVSAQECGSQESSVGIHSLNQGEYWVSPASLALLRKRGSTEMTHLVIGEGGLDKTLVQRIHDTHMDKSVITNENYEGRELDD